MALVAYALVLIGIEGGATDSTREFLVVTIFVATPN